MRRMRIKMRVIITIIIIIAALVVIIRSVGSLRVSSKRTISSPPLIALALIRRSLLTR